jgi:hypothetical protein
VLRATFLNSLELIPYERHARAVSKRAHAREPLRLARSATHAAHVYAHGCRPQEAPFVRREEQSARDSTLARRLASILYSSALAPSIIHLTTDPSGASKTAESRPDWHAR